MSTCLEVLNGYRPVSHLRAMSSPSHATAVAEAITGAVRRVARADGASTGSRTVRVKVRRMRVCEPRPGIAEISVVLGAHTDEGSKVGGRVGGRCWAAAFRLERLGNSWRCTVARVL